jgi:TAP-like protein
LTAEAPRFAAGLTIQELTPTCDKMGIASPPVATITPYTGSGPILVVGGQHDPATPFRWATQMVTDFGGAASAGGTANVTLVTFTGEGHSTFLSSTCTTNIMAELIATAKQAAGGTVCDPDKPLTAPDYYDSLPAVPSVTTFDITGFKAFLGLDPTQYFSTGAVTDLDADKVGPAYGKAWASVGLNDAGVSATPTAEGFYRTEFVRAKDQAQILVIAVSAADLGKEPVLAPLVTAMGTSKTLVIQIVFAS